MATTTNITTTYAGERKGKYISAALLGANTIRNGGVTVKPNINYKEVVKRLETTSLMANATCDFTPTDTVTITERILEPKELQINLELCKKDFRSDWDAIEMGYSIYDKLPKSFADYLMQYVVTKAAAATEVSLWQGDKTNAGEFDGFETLVSVDTALPAAQEVTGTTITSSNVVTELRKILAAVPSALVLDPDFQIYAGDNIVRSYIQHLSGYGTSGLGAAGTDDKGSQWYSGGQLTIDGTKIFHAKGMTANVAIATTKDNLWFGTSLMSDHTVVKLIDTSETLGDQNVRVVMRFTAGAQYGVVEDIVTYGITNAVN